MQTQPPEKIVFKFLDGARKNDVASFQQASVTLGRAPGSDLEFRSGDYRMVSNHHAVVRFRGHGFELVDAQSTNGTYINGTRTRGMFIKSGDIIRLGKTGPEVEVFIPADTGEHTVMETLSYRPSRQGGGEPLSLTDPEVNDKVMRIRHLRFIRRTLFVALGMAAGFAGFSWTVIEGLQLSPGPLYFKSALYLIAGGVLTAAVFAVYHGRPGRQRFQLGEGLWIGGILVTCLAGVYLLWH